MDLSLEFLLLTIVGSFVGAVFSWYVSSDTIVAVFAVLALIAAGLMFLPLKDKEEVRVETFSFSHVTAFSIPLVLGFFLGLVGQGGAFILISVMLYTLRSLPDWLSEAP
ncbi:MAG TPA: hypothetical protein DCZ05_03690 [Deltaproteobacteria bacterium]|nr:hypothetical protein [Deltaproteobacteria bacterium]